MAIGKHPTLGPAACAMRSIVVAALVGRATLVTGLAAAEESVPDVTPPAAATPAPGSVHRAPRAGIAGRVQLLTAELGLDARQQQAVASVLVQQRTEVAKVWSDPSVPAALRVSAIGDTTAERIRAILNEDQRKKYMQPRQHEAPVGAPGGDVQKWMQSAQGLEPAGVAAAKGD